MKKKLFLAIVITTILCCLFAIGISAAEPDTTKETVTLDDGTVCALWDTDGNPLHWYITATDADTDAKTYAYIAANDAAVDYNNGWSGGDQLGTMTITIDGTSYDKTKFAVVNLYGAKITSGQRIGNAITRFSKTFTGASNLEYAYVPVATTVFGAEDFKNCSNLKYVNLEELTELTSVGSQSFNGCPKLFDGQTLDLSNTKLVSTATNAFATVAFTNVKLPETTFTSLGTQTFCNCQKLETVTGTKNATFGLGNYSFQKCYKLKQLDGLIENGILIIPEGTTSVGSFAFTECDAIEYIEFPSTFTYVGQQGFSYMSNVKLMDFSKITGKLTLNNCGHFRDMDNLVAVSLPEGMTEVNNRAFASCDNLTAFYMPNSVQKLSSNGGGQGTFCDSKKMYFVQKSFTVSQCLVNGVVDTSKLVLPEKPEIYYMPTSLTTFTGHIYSNDTWSNATIFRSCTSLNNVLVFPESFTVMVTMRPFEGMGTESSPKTIVFTGDMTQMTLPHQSRYITYVFANANDKDFSSFEIMRTTSVSNSNDKNSYAYFCSTGKKYELNISGRQGSGQDPTTEENIAKIAATIEAIHATATDGTYHVHDKNKDETSAATCELPAGSFTYCFCGTLMTSDIVEGSVALGHTDLNAIVEYYYKNNNYFDASYKKYTCTREGCGEVIDSQEGGIPALFKAMGMTVPDYGISALCHAIKIETDAVKEYNAYLGEGNEIKYGVLAGVAIDGNKPVGADGKSNCDAIVMGFESTNFSIVQLKLTGLEKANKQLYCGAYAVVDGTVSYLYEGTVSEYATPLTVNNGILDQTTPEATVEETKEN